MMQPDPFTDAAFLDRLGKLLPMLGSNQGGEADAARRKLLDHLGQHRLSLTDVALRLRGAPPPRPPPPPPAGRETELLRELELVRHARAAAEQMARSALQQNTALQHRASVAEAEVQALVVRRNGTRIIAFASTLLALALALVVVVQNLPGGVMLAAPLPSSGAATMQPSRPPATSAPTGLTMGGAPMNPAEHLGYVLSNDIAVRADAVPDSAIRGFLPRGTEVIVMRALSAGGLDWLLVRSSLGIGFVPAAAISLAGR